MPPDVLQFISAGGSVGTMALVWLIASMRADLKSALHRIETLERRVK